MRNFQYEETHSDQKIEEIINYRRRKIQTQQIIYSSILFVILAALGLYTAKRIVYSEFDGYIQTDYDYFRALDDIFVVEHYTQEGDIVHPGDTLYSYIYMSNITNFDLLYSRHEVEAEDRSMRLQSMTAALDANVLRVRQKELKDQIKKEDRNIRLGITDNSHKMDLERELAETDEQLNVLMSKIAVYDSITALTSQALRRAGLSHMDNRDNVVIDAMMKSAALRYVQAYDTSVVTKKWSTSGMPVFKGDAVLQLQSMNLRNCNMKVMAYIPTNDMHKISNHTQAEIIVNDDISFTATVQLLGARTEELPSELRNSLSHIYTAVMVIFKPDPGQSLPFWAAVDRVPVRIRVKKFGPDVTTRVGDWWYVDENGVTLETEPEPKKHKTIADVLRSSAELILDQEKLKSDTATVARPDTVTVNQEQL